MSYLGSDSLTFGALRAANLKRLPLFKDALGNRAHSEKDGSDWTIADWFTATTGELGELGNLLKKIRRGDITLNIARPEIAKELADVVTYLDILAYQCGVDLGNATKDKWNEVSERQGILLRLDNDDWHLTK